MAASGDESSARQPSATQRPPKGRCSTIRRSAASSTRSCSSRSSRSLFYMAATNAIDNLRRAKIASGLRLPRQHRRLRHQPDADPLQRRRLDLRRRLHRRPSEHAPRRGDRHRASRPSSASRRHRAAVEELDGRQARDGLCRGRPQHPAAAAAAVLVQRGAGAAAAAAQLARASAPGFFLNSRGLFMPRPLFAGDAWLVLCRARRSASSAAFVFRRWAKRQQEATGRQYPVGLVDPRRSSSACRSLVWVVLGARRREPDHLRHAARRAPSTCAAACRSCRNSWRSCSAS